MRSLQEQEEISDAIAAENRAVHLDALAVPKDQGIRILVRPLIRARSISPVNVDSCKWLQLTTAELAEPKQPGQKVLAVTQTSRDIKFTARMACETLENETGLDSSFELYYDPASNNQIFLNLSRTPLVLSKISRQPATGTGIECTIYPHTTKTLIPGTWRIKVQGINVLDFRLVEKRPALLRSRPSLPPSDSWLDSPVNSCSKRTLAAQRSHDGVVMCLRPANATETEPSVLPLLSADTGQDRIIPSGNPLLELRDGDIIELPGAEVESDVYTIKKLGPIASTSLSAVGKAEFSREPESIITIKVLKTRLKQSIWATAKPEAAEKNIIRQADIWLHEFLNHEVLNHEAIPRLLGGDARYLSLYMEYVDGKDLAAKGEWQDGQTTFFTGTREDSVRILRDVAGALHYIHRRGLVHNDIKPGNILFNRKRGAVLCDYGMMTSQGGDQLGGTPFYICPEFIGEKLRDRAADVWALGVTMLYVFGKIGLPDSRGRKDHPGRLYWNIADINTSVQNQQRSADYDGRTAAQKMQTWLGEVFEAESRLNEDDKLELIVKGMLLPKPQSRLTMADVVRELSRTRTPCRPLPENERFAVIGISRPEKHAQHSSMYLLRRCRT